MEDSTAPPSVAAAGPLSWAIFALARLHRARAAEMLRALGLHPGQELLLMRLYDRDGQSQSELLEAVGLDHSTVSKSISRMQQAGLVVRAPAEHDRRVQVVTLTDRGRALREPIEQIWRELERVSTADVPASRVRAFVATAGAVERAIRAGERPR